MLFDIGKALAFPGFHGDLAVKPLRAEVGPGLGHLGGVTIQAVDEKAFVGMKGGSQFAVTAAEIDDQPALDPARLQDFRSLLGPVLSGTKRGSDEHRQ